MSTPIPREAPRVVVGVDGSDQSELALRWAAHLVGLAGAEIDAVLAWTFPVTYGWSVGRGLVATGARVASNRDVGAA